MPLLPHTRPMHDALTAYGIDPLMTPETVEMTETTYGLLVDQYLTDGDGALILHEGDRGVGDKPVIVKRFFPHPANGSA